MAGTPGSAQWTPTSTVSTSNDIWDELHGTALLATAHVKLATPDNSEYLYQQPDKRGPDSIVFGIAQALPPVVETVTNVDVSCYASLRGDPWTDDGYSVRAQMFESDGVTPLTDAVTLVATTPDPQYVWALYSGVFTILDPSPASWIGARLSLTWELTRINTADGAYLAVSQLAGNFDYDSTPTRNNVLGRGHVAAVQVGHGHTFVDVFSYGDAVAQGAPVSFEQDYSNLAQGMFTTAVYLAGRNTDAAGTLTTSNIGALLELVMAPANGINLIEGQVVTQDHALIDSDTNATGEVEGETVALDYQITGADTDSVGLVDAVEMINYILVGADADGQHGIEWVSLAPTLTLGSSSSLSVNIMSAQTYTPVERRWSNVAQGYFVTDAALAAPGYVQQFNYVEGAPVSTFADVITAHDLVTVPVVLSAIIQQRNITTDAADINNSNQVEAVSTIFESLPLEGSDLNAGGEVKTASLDVVYPLEARDLSDGSPFLQSLTDDYSRDDKAVEMVSFVGRLFMSLDDLENWAVINAIYAPHERRWSNLAQGYFVTDALIAAHDLESTGAVRGNAVTLTPHLIERDLENTGEVQSVVLGVDVQLTADNAYGAGQVSEGVVDQPEGIVVTNIEAFHEIQTVFVLPELDMLLDNAANDPLVERVTLASTHELTADNTVNTGRVQGRGLHIYVPPEVKTVELTDVSTRVELVRVTTGRSLVELDHGLVLTG